MKSRLVAALVFCVAVPAAPPVPDCTAVSGWRQHEETRSFVPDNLFDYMNGNAEGYLIYGFRRMTGITCRSGDDTILIDVSEMADAESAYGIFASNRHPRFPVEKIGTAGQVMPRKATFAKGSYYVELAANPEKDHTPALRAFVAGLEKLVPGATSLPEALAWFSTEGLTAYSVRLVPESVLGIRLLRRGYVAQYDYGKAFVVGEKNPEAARALMEKWRARIGKTEPAQIADEAFLASDRYLGRLCVFRKGRYVAGFANLAEGQDGTARASALAAKIP